MTDYRWHYASLRVLQILLANPEGQYGLQLSKKSRLKPGTIYPILARLQERGLAVSEAAKPTKPMERRRYIVKLTEEGQRVAEAVLGPRGM